MFIDYYSSYVKNFLPRTEQVSVDRRVVELYDK